jgi:hypothetical protein
LWSDLTTSRRSDPNLLYDLGGGGRGGGTGENSSGGVEN